jgi:mannose-1-phosphate guanylyltransferase
MKALVLAAGFGTRLGQLTLETPKALIRVDEKPILGFCLDQLWIAGVKEVIINSHYLSTQIEEFIQGYETELIIQLSYEEKLLGTAGTLKKHIDFLSSEDFVVMHADNFFSDTLANFIGDHKSRKVGKYGTLGTFETRDPKNCGVLVLNSDKTILEFHEKVENPPTNIANAAIYVFTPEIYDLVQNLSPNENDLSKNLIPKLMKEMYTHNFTGLFVDIGTPEGLKIANDYTVELNRSKTI